MVLCTIVKLTLLIAPTQPFSMLKKAHTQKDIFGLQNQKLSQKIYFDTLSDTIVLSDPEPIEHDPSKELDPNDNYGSGWDPVKTVS